MKMMKTFTPHDTRHVYFVKKIGWFNWQVWFHYRDESRDPHSGSKEWKACWGVRFFRWINAARVAQDLQAAYHQGLYDAQRGLKWDD